MQEEVSAKALQRREERAAAKQLAQEMGPDFAYCSKCRKVHPKDDMLLNKDGSVSTVCNKYPTKVKSVEGVKKPVLKKEKTTTIARRYYRYQERIQNKGLEMMPFEEFSEMWKEFSQKLCRFCDRGFTRNAPPHLQFSIDRIDESKGYVAGNCQPAHRRCNYIKGSKNTQNFQSDEELMYHCGLMFAKNMKEVWGFIDVGIRVYEPPVRFVIL
jgi:hypothetical protein